MSIKGRPKEEKKRGVFFGFFSGGEERKTIGKSKRVGFWWCKKKRERKYGKIKLKRGRAFAEGQRERMRELFVVKMG